MDETKGIAMFREWDAQGRQIRAWSTPVAVRRGEDWEYFLAADMQFAEMVYPEDREHPDEVVDLRPFAAVVYA